MSFEEEITKKALGVMEKYTLRASVFVVIISCFVLFAPVEDIKAFSENRHWAWITLAAAIAAFAIVAVSRIAVFVVETREEVRGQRRLRAISKDYESLTADAQRLIEEIVKRNRGTISTNYETDEIVLLLNKGYLVADIGRGCDYILTFRATAKAETAVNSIYSEDSCQ